MAENKTIFDFINESAIKGNDEIPIWKVLPDGSGKSSRVSFDEFIASLPSTQAEAPTEVSVTSVSTPLELHSKRFYLLTLGSNTEITSTISSLGKRFEPNSTVDFIFISTEKRTVTFTSEFNLPTKVNVEGKVGVRFKALSANELVPISAAGGGTGSSKLKSSLTVAGTTWGGVKSGDVFPAGTDIEDILVKALRVAGSPIYRAATATLAMTGSQYSVEAGSNIDLFLRATYTKNDAGDATQAVYYKNGAEMTALPDTVAPFEHDEAVYAIGDQEISYNAIISHSGGPVKNNALGEPDPTGQIAAGTVSTNLVVFKGLRKLFFGFDKDTLDSANIRALQNDILHATKGQTFNINIPTGTRKVHFAYPATLGDVESVVFKEGLMVEVKGAYTKTTVQVQGANGFTAIAYNVYTFTPATPFEYNYTHIVKI